MTQERNLNLDFIKIIAMILVIGIHSGTKWMIGDIDINRYLKLTLCGSAIPLFFTVSGYLLLGRKNIDWRYSAKKIWGIVRFVFLVCWIYWLIMLIITQEPHWDKLYKDPLGAFLMGGTFWQFWYFGAMCLTYLLYPFLNSIYIEKQKTFVRLFIFIIIICTTVLIINTITPGTFEKRIPQPFRIWNWLMYFCLGGYIKMNPKVIHWKWVLLLAFVYCAQLVVVKYVNPTMFKADYNYASLLTLFYVYCLFQVLNHVNIHKIGGGIKQLSSLFLPVYTIHPFFIYNTQDFRHTFHAGYPIYWMIITVASIAVSWVIMQTKVGKWVFRI